MKNLILAVVLVSLVLTAGCVSETNTNQPEQQNTNQPEQTGLYAPPAGTPSISIISPKNGDSISLTTVGIKVNVTNFRLVGIIANPVNKNNEGHIKYTLGSREKNSPYISDSFANVAPGTYTIRTELRNNDDTPLSPAVYGTVTITVK